MAKAPSLIDRQALSLHRARAKRGPNSFLHEEAAHEVKEKLADVNKALKSPLLVGHVSEPFQGIFPDAPIIEDTPDLQAQQCTHDLVMHIFGLHTADDPVGQLVQSRLALKPDGLFLGVLFGGGTLQELRAALAEAETRVLGGLSPRVMPMAEIRDLGGLLQRAGLALPVADSRKLTVRYPDLSTLVADIRAMGESNALANRIKTPSPRRMFALAEEIYAQHFSDDGYLVATFELIFLTGWAPGPGQQKPLPPGSATSRLADVLGVDEKSLKRETP